MGDATVVEVGVAVAAAEVGDDATLVAVAPITGTAVVGPGVGESAVVVAAAVGATVEG